MKKLITQKINVIEVFEKNDRFWVTSLDVAEKFEKRHDNVLQSIENLECSEKFSLLNFQERDYKDDRGKDQKSYLISRGGFSFLAMGFTGKKAAEWKEKYILAFDQMEKTIIEQAKQIRRESNKEHKQLKADNKAARRIGTDHLKRWVDYTLAQGTKNPNRWYSLLTEAQYDAIIIPGGHMEIRRRKNELKKKNGHDVLTDEELLSLTMMNLTFTGKAVDESLAVGGDYHKDSPMLNLVKERFKQYGEIIEKRLLLQTSNETPLLN